MSDAAPGRLDEFLRRDDGSFRWRRGGRNLIALEAQTWQGGLWTHALSITEGAGETAILIVTGGEPNDLDLAEERLTARMSGLPVCTLYHVPNQPIFGRVEDDLIAHTFVNFLETGDPAWPLLFPMAKSVIRAMDALQEASEGKIRKFVVTGMSKRGWTTWLVGASRDPRVAGLAPMVFDTLNAPAQMRHQLETWGDYSEEIVDYSSRGLLELLTTPEGARLSELVDPYAYRSVITAPTLIVNGANDRYWQVDALNFYWEGLRQPKWLSVVPNAGHLLGDKVQKLEALAAFARSAAGEFAFPTPEWSIDEGELSDLRPAGHLWAAASPTLDFRDSEWRPAGAPWDPALNYAAMQSRRYEIEGSAFTLTSPVRVFRSPRR